MQERPHHFCENSLDAADGGEKRSADTLPTPHLCRLGRWYDGISDPDTRSLPSFRALDEPHHAVHDAGRRALAALAVEDMAEARREVAAMQTASIGVQSALDAFGREFPSVMGTEARNPSGDPRDGARAAA